jgi:flavin reductase (DIM6/NTAB) family NADH-FMN oxidoreductase RutF
LHYVWRGKTLKGEVGGRLRTERCENEKGRGLPMAVTQAEFRKALGSFATGVTVITVDYEGEVNGMTANAFASVSLDPPLVLVCVDHKARTHAHLHAKKRFGVNVLAEDQQMISEYYARPSQDHRHAEREAGAGFDRTAHGTPVLRDALAYLECRLHTAQDAGDHTIFIAEVEEVVVRNGDPLLYHRGEYRAIDGSNTKSRDAQGQASSAGRKP